MARARRPAPRGPARAPTSCSRTRSRTSSSARVCSPPTFLAEHATGRRRVPRRGAGVPRRRSPPTICGVPAADIERLATLLGTVRPGVVRLGWGPERNRNGGSACVAVFALPVLAGQFGVPGSGVIASLGNATPLAWDAREPDTPPERRRPRAFGMNTVRRRALRPDARPADRRAVRPGLEPRGHQPRPAGGAARARTRGPLHRGARPGAHRHRAVRRRRAAGHDALRDARPRRVVRRVRAAGDPAR